MNSMTVCASRFFKILVLLCVIGACAWLQYLMDDGLGLTWPENAMRNWQQFGLLNLHGKLVSNPGGFEILTNPTVQKGYSPVCSYLAYFTTQIFAWTGLGTLSFHILLVIAVFWATWDLLGRDNFAFAVAAATVLSPGYARWQRFLDMNAICVLLGLPYMAIVVSLLKKPRLGFGSFIGLLALTLMYLSLNWSTAWILGPCVLLLLGLPQINLRAVVIFVIMAGAGCGAIVIASVLSRVSINAGTGTGHGNLHRFISSYLWGGAGYDGRGLTTGRAALRLFFVNGTGLLPLLMICGYVAVKYFRRQISRDWIVISPFVMSIVPVGVMRNYFAHHPWMAAPVLLVGLIFSLVLLRVHMAIARASASGEIIPRQSILFLPAASVTCFIYGLAVVMFLRANEANQLSLIKLVRHHTRRSDYIVILKNVDPATADLAPRFDIDLDRHVGVAADLAHLPASKDQIVILSSVPLNGALKLLAQTSTDEKSSPPWLHKAANWFNHAIARRRPGDRLELANDYFLYETKS
jgi:hypothetical protein